MPGISGTAPLNAARSTFHSKKRSTTTSIGFSLLTGGTMRSTEQSGKPTYWLAPVTLGLVEVLEDSLPELCGGADAVFAGDDIERLGDACIPACGDTRRDGSGDAGQHGQPHRRGDEFRPGDLGGKFRAPESIAEMSVMRICSQTVSMI